MVQGAGCRVQGLGMEVEVMGVWGLEPGFIV